MFPEDKRQMLTSCQLKIQLLFIIDSLSLPGFGSKSKWYWVRFWLVLLTNIQWKVSMGTLSPSSDLFSQENKLPDQTKDWLLKKTESVWIASPCAPSLTERQKRLATNEQMLCMMHFFLTRNPFLSFLKPLALIHWFHGLDMYKPSTDVNWIFWTLCWPVTVTHPFKPGTWDTDTRELCLKPA